MGSLSHAARAVRLVLAVLAILILIVPASCKKDPASPSGGDTEGTTPMTFPEPYLPRPSSIGEGEEAAAAKVVLMTSLNLAYQKIERARSAMTIFQRTTWKPDGRPGCVKDATGDMVCSYSITACGGAEAMTWQALADARCSGTGQPELAYKGSTTRTEGSFQRYNTAARTVLCALDWRRDVFGTHWSLYEGGADPGHLLATMTTRPALEEMDEYHWTLADTSKWDMTSTLNGQRGEAEFSWRPSPADPWRVRHRITWRDGHGEWQDRTAGGDPVLRDW